MTKMQIDLGELVRSVSTLDRDAMSEAERLHNSLTKPPGSLGKLEWLGIRISGILRIVPPTLGKKVVFTMAADHGVTVEGVSAYPSEVTAQMVLNFARGGAAINVLARHVGAEVRVVDMGVSSGAEWPACVVNRKVARGTRNMATGPAMSRDEAIRALLAGAELAFEAASEGTRAIGVGDMGIGNTTAASAITAAITGKPVAAVTGRGTGIDDSALALKVKVIERALAVNRPDSADGLDVLAKVGGLEIAGMAGVMLGAAARRIPVFLDGFVSGSAALIAAALCPLARDYMIASHMSAEPGHRHVLEHLGLVPVLDLGMRLGEGTGAALAFTIAEAACKIMAEMATFDSAGVSKSRKEVGA